MKREFIIIASLQSLHYLAMKQATQKKLQLRRIRYRESTYYIEQYRSYWSKTVRTFTLLAEKLQLVINSLL